MIEEAKCVAGSRVIVCPFDSFVLVSHTDGWPSSSSTIRSAHLHSYTNKYFSPLLRINRLSGEFTNTWHWLVRAICQKKTNIRMFVGSKKMTYTFHQRQHRSTAEFIHSLTAFEFYLFAGVYGACICERTLRSLIEE